MDYLWSPWRYAYVSSPKDTTACVFCIDESDENDAERLILFRGEYNFVILNLYPYTSGHLMVAPYAHVSRLADIPGASSSEMMALSARAIGALDGLYAPDGYNIGMNLGAAAGAAVRHHLHMHVVPRWNGDANFMTIAGETRVLPEELGSVYRKLREALVNTVTGPST